MARHLVVAKWLAGCGQDRCQMGVAHYGTGALFIFIARISNTPLWSIRISHFPYKEVSLCVWCTKRDFHPMPKDRHSIALLCSAHKLLIARTHVNVHRFRQRPPRSLFKGGVYFIDAACMCGIYTRVVTTQGQRYLRKLYGM